VAAGGVAGLYSEASDKLGGQEQNEEASSG
jgi:hypothetical protein